MSIPLNSGESKKPMMVVAEAILVAVLVGFMGTYFWMSYKKEVPPIVQEKPFTYHDDLMNIHRGTNGDLWAVGKNGIILHIKDGGRTWKRQVSGTNNALMGISFDQKDRVGFAVGNGGIILATQDGGFSWKVQAGGEKNLQALFGVQVVDETKAYAVGGFGTFLSSSDGGKNWIKYKFSWEELIPDVVKTVSGTIEPNLNAVCFVSEKIGWVVGEFGMILHTKDGGQTWITQRSGPNLPELFDVLFIDGLRGFAMGQQGALINTKDGGKNWLPSNITARNLYGADFENNRFVVVGDRIFLEGENDFSTWTKMSLKENLVLNSVAVMGNVAVAVGQGAVIKEIKRQQNEYILSSHYYFQ